MFICPFFIRSNFVSLAFATKAEKQHTGSCPRVIRQRNGSRLRAYGTRQKQSKKLIVCLSLVPLLTLLWSIEVSPVRGRTASSKLLII